jgi:microsomal dipeptidase-like Zn-dependent dipeptidase
VSFTGSVDTGRKVATATAPNFVRCQLEMGSKNALVIADDADINIAVEATIAGSFSGAGQKCTASSRLVVMDGIHDAYVEALIKRMSQLKVGHALEEGVFMGPVVDGNQLDANFGWMENARQSGAELAFGGERLSLEHEGYYMSPTLFINTNNKWEVNQEEVFAPMASVIRVADLEEAIATTNDTRFGLTGGIITQSLRTSSLFKQQAQTGCVMVNLPTAGTDYHVPFGGRKESSFGPREQGQYAKEFYTVVKTAYDTLSRFAEWNLRFEQNADLIMPVHSMADIDVAKAEGKVGIFFGAQNCSPIDDEIGLVEVMRQQGLLIMQLTYNNQSLLATGCYEKNDTGITRFGQQVIEEMNRVGMVVDMSHSAERSTLEAIALSSRPICISHANPTFAHDALRNKSDTVIKALAERGGLLGFSLYPFHLPNGSECTLDDFCQMVAKTADMVGIDHLGIGSDLCLNQPQEVHTWSTYSIQQ